MIYSKSFNEEFRNYLTNWTKSNGINSSDSKIKRYHASKVIISLSNESSLKWFYSYLKEYRKQYFQPEFFRVKIGCFPENVSNQFLKFKIFYFILIFILFFRYELYYLCSPLYNLYRLAK